MTDLLIIAKQTFVLWLLIGAEVSVLSEDELQMPLCLQDPLRENLRSSWTLRPEQTEKQQSENTEIRA